LVIVVGDLHWKIVSVYIHRTGQVFILSKIYEMELSTCPFITMLATISGNAENEEQTRCRNYYQKEKE